MLFRSHLRQAVRAHRIDGGWLQLAVDPLHQALLRPGPGLLPRPAIWHGVPRLADLVRHAVLDGALVSSLAADLAVDRTEEPPSGPSTVPDLVGDAGLHVWNLAELPLRLVASGPLARAVLVPPAEVAPGLHRELGRRGLALRVGAARDLIARSWLRGARSQDLALPLCPALLPPGWLARQGWRLLPDQEPLPQQLWLLLSADLPLALQEHCRRRLLRRCTALTAHPSRLR